MLTNRTALTARPEDFAGHVFLDGRNRGNCKTLVGHVMITSILVDDGNYVWTDRDIMEFQIRQYEATTKMLTDALGYNAPLQISHQYIRCSVSQLMTPQNAWQWVTMALSAAGLPMRETVTEYLCNHFGVKEAPIFFCVNRPGRSFCFTDYGNFEFAVLYQDQGDYRHELFHLFGMRDLYMPDSILKLAQKHLPNSIMYTGDHSVVDPLTAYLAGWTDQITGGAVAFLRETAGFTDERLRQEISEVLKDGYGTVDFGDGVYEGELSLGVPNGKGRMRWSNGDTYVGDWEDGVATGFGTMCWSNGTTYTGSWKRWKMNGQGTMTFPNGKVQKGIWAYDCFLG